MTVREDRNGQTWRYITKRWIPHASRAAEIVDEERHVESRTSCLATHTCIVTRYNIQYDVIIGVTKHEKC
jgi:hypothetical protein